jgi:MFS family permease
VVIYLQRGLFGVGIATLFSAYFTFAADIIPTTRRTEGLALFGISGLVPMLINPFAAELDIAAPDLRWFLPAIGGFILLSVMPLAPLREPPRDRSERLAVAAALRGLAAQPLVPVWFASALFSGLVAIFMTFATVAAERRGIARPATLWLAYAVAAIFVRAAGAKLPDRIGPSQVVIPAILLYLGAMLLAAHSTSRTGFMFAALLAGLGHGCCFPVLTGQVVSRSPERYRGSALTAFTALWGVMELVAAPGFGAIADRHGDAAMFTTASLTGFGGLGVWTLLERRFAAKAA